jgi:hypothetical protein
MADVIQKMILKIYQSVFRPILSWYGAIATICIMFSIEYKFCSCWGITATIIIPSIYYLWYYLCPAKTFRYKIRGKDATIELSIGNLFLLKGNSSLVIGFNANLETKISQNCIAEDSIQGQFTKKYYNGEDEQLKQEINFYIEKNNIRKENGLIALGEVIQINRASSIFYLPIIASFSAMGKATSSDEIIIEQVLPSLWQHINTHSGNNENIALPLLGTGYSGISATRQNIIEAIIDTYMIACAERVPCKKLTIVIHPKDKDHIDMEELKRYIELKCEFAKFANNNTSRNGIPIQSFA